MNGQGYRAETGGLIDRARPVRFSFDGGVYTGFAGDTVASALIANGVHLVGRSFKYHRPRGVYTAGPEEPNALLQLRSGAHTEPNARATMVEIHEGLVTESQNRWPSLGFDIGALNSMIAPFIPAGFYYKTFMWPAHRWMSYEKFIRKAAGLGKGAVEPDPDRYEKRFAHCDVLVVGAGPAGLAAALAAARSGARVILADENPEFGGALRRERHEIDGRPALDWVRHAIDTLAAAGEVTLLRRTTVYGYYDHNYLTAVERVADHLPAPPLFTPRQRVWQIRARQVVLATGAIERPLVFGNNDRPGVMLASAARAYVNQYAAHPGTRAVIFANNDGGYRTALDLHAAGIEIAAVVDARRESAGPLSEAAKRQGLAILAGHVVGSAEGGKRVTGARVRPTGGGATRVIGCDLLAVSGGWNPTVHLYSQSGGKVVFDDALHGFVPGPSRQAERSAGAARGRLALADCLSDGAKAGAEAAMAAGFKVEPGPAHTASETAADLPMPLWEVPADGHRKRFVDIQDDVTADDIALAHRESYRSVEHLKRYTTLGMGTDQGKTSNVNGLAIMAKLRGAEVGKVGTTTFRPPYTPVTIGAIAGRETGHHFMATRRSAMHAWHERAGAEFVDAGLWVRPRFYPRAGEDINSATRREVIAVRNNVGLVDVSSLGKIDIQGRDAAELLDRVYVNGWKKLDIGKARYGLMLREDGIVFDDGTTTRLGPQHYLMTTTTANAVKVMQHLEYYLQTEWSDLDVHAVSVTEHYAAMALAGPNAREVLKRAVNEADVSNAGLPHLGYREARVAGIPARIFRISYSGELAYEVNVPADYGEAAWIALMEAGKSFNIIPYGTEAMGVMRIEKGHVVVGSEIDGRTTAEDLGLGRMGSRLKWYIGKSLLDRPGMKDPGRQQLVGLIPVDRTTRLPRGAQITAAAMGVAPEIMLGHVTAGANSPTIGHPIALALLAGGLAHKGQTLHARFPMRNLSIPVVVTDPIFYDPEGARLHA